MAHLSIPKRGPTKPVIPGHPWDIPISGQTCGSLTRTRELVDIQGAPRSRSYWYTPGSDPWTYGCLYGFFIYLHERWVYPRIKIPCETGCFVWFFLFTDLHDWKVQKWSKMNKGENVGHTVWTLWWALFWLDKKALFSGEFDLEQTEVIRAPGVVCLPTFVYHHLII